MAPGERTRLDVVQRVPGGPTGALATLPHAWEAREGGTPASLASAHVAYPSGDAVVILEVLDGALAPGDAHVVRPASARGAEPPDDATCSFVAWAPGDARRGVVAFGRGAELHVYAPPATDLAASDDASARASSDPATADGAGATERRPAFTPTDRVPLDAAATSAAWTTDGEGLVVTAASGRVGLWRRADRTLAPLGRAAAPQTLVAAGAGLGFAHATAARGSRDVSLWRRGGASEADSSETDPRAAPASLTHPSP